MVESIAECSPWSIPQYFWPELSDNWSWKPICGLFVSVRFTQILLYCKHGWGAVLYKHNFLLLVNAKMTDIFYTHRTKNLICDRFPH